MRIVVVGGNHGTGAEVASAALAAGHEVVSLSRSGSEPRPGVTEVQGDGRDQAIVASAIAGADAVVVTVGAAAGSTRNRTDVTDSVVRAMRAVGVRRLVVQSSLGVGDSMELMPRAARLLARAALGRALADHADQEEVVRSSGLDWTILRPGGLRDTPASGQVLSQETRDGRPMLAWVGRADLAACTLAVIADQDTIGKSLAVGTPRG